MSKKKYVTPLWAAIGNDRCFVPLSCSMLLSPAYMALSPKQKELYCYCRLELYKSGEFKAEDGKFFMNREKWARKYHLYSETSGKSFRQDMAKLIEYGFIDCIEKGGNPKAKSRNLYKFSTRWKDWKPNTECPNTAKTTAMLNKQYTREEAT